MGIMAYLGSPLWFLFLLLGTWVAWDRYSSGLSRLPFETYVDRWFHIDGIQQSLILTAGVFALLFIPKILAVTGAILSTPTRRSFGGMFPILAGSFLETIVSMLLAPCIMAAHTLMVMSIALGRAVGWGNQNRETDGTSWGDAIRFHAFPTVLGIVWTALALKISPTFAAWMSPILLGLVLAAPVSVWTSRSRYGRALARHHILATPEELNPPIVILLADRAKAAVDPALDASSESRLGIVAAVVDPYVNGVHVSLLEHSEITEAEEALAERCLISGPDDLTKNELSELLYLAPAMLMMHRAVWLRSAEGIHNVWTQAVESYRRRLDHHSPEPT
jgi:membrane glycosyltransferase